MKFRPCIDLHQGKVKQIIGATLTATEMVENFVSDKDAAYYAELFKADRLSGGHVIMLGPGNEAQAFKALRAYPGGLQAGGGITADNASAYLEAGAARVIVTSYIFPDGSIDFKRLKALFSRVGKEHLVIDLSCRRKNGRFYVVTDRWRNFTDFEINPENLRELSGYCAEFLIHGVDAEGKKEGVMADLIEKLGEWAEIPTTYAGGVGNWADLELVERLGRGRLDITVGSALDIFGGSLPYREVVKRFNEKL